MVLTTSGEVALFMIYTEGTEPKEVKLLVQCNDKPRAFMPSYSLLKCKFLKDKNFAIFIFRSPSVSTQDPAQSRYSINVCLVKECV